MGGWAGLEVGVGLNGMGEGLQLPDIKLFVRGVQGITERNNLNWVFGVSCIVLTLSTCVLGGKSYCCFTQVQLTKPF